MPHPYFVGTRAPKVLAHRGLVTAEMVAHGSVENSQEAVAAAVKAGAEYVESDCHLTRDGEVVLFHDSSLRRVTGDPRMIAEVTLAELTELMASRGGLLTLRGALETFPSTRFNIDVKADAAAVPAGQIIGEFADRVLLASFSDKRRGIALRAAHDVAVRRAANAWAGRPATSAGQASMIKILFTVLFGSKRAKARAFENIDALQIPERQGPVPVLTRRLLRAAHSAGVEVHVWTVNDPARMKQLLDLGVDGVVTDRSDLALRLHEFGALG